MDVTIETDSLHAIRAVPWLEEKNDHLVLGVGLS